MIKQIIILILIASAGTSVYAQKIPKWKLPENPLFFTGISHELHIQPFDADPEFISIKSSSGYISKMNDTTFIIRFDLPQEDIKLKLFYKKLPVDIINAKVTAAVAPRLLISGVENGPISKEKLENLEELEFIFPSGFPASGISLYSARMTIKVNANSRPTTIQLNSSLLTPQAKEMIKKIESGGSLSFDNIMFITRMNNVLNIPRESHIFTVTQ